MKKVQNNLDNKNTKKVEVKGKSTPKSRLKIDDKEINSTEKDTQNSKKSRLKLDDKEVDSKVEIDKSKSSSKAKQSKLKIDDIAINIVVNKEKSNSKAKSQAIKTARKNAVKSNFRVEKNFEVQKKNRDVSTTRKSYKTVKAYKIYNNAKGENYSISSNKLSKNRTVQKLYQKHLSNTLKLEITPKIEKSPKVQLSQKSQMAIRLYNELNPDNSKTQLEKYNVDFNNRSYRYNYNRKNFVYKSNYNKSNFKRMNYNENNFKRLNYRNDSKRSNLKEKFSFNNYQNYIAMKNFTNKAKRVNYKAKINRTNFDVYETKKTDIPNQKQKYKRFLKKKYAQAFRDTMKKEEQAKSNQTTYENMQNSTKKVFTVVVKTFMNIVKPLIIPFLLFVIICVIICSMALFFIAIIQGPFASSVSSTYTAEEEDILTVESTYCEIEDELREDIANIETDYPNYDYYEYHIDPIGHDPHELASYLTALLIAYTTETAQVELDRLFELMYVLEFEEVEGEEYPLLKDDDGNQLYDDDDNPLYSTESVPIVTLVVTLTSNSIYDIAMAIMTDDEFAMFELLLETRGNNEDIFSGESSISTMSIMSVETSESPSIATSHYMITNSDFARTVKIGEQFIGQPYVWGGSSPTTGFDCSGFISYILNQSGVASFPRTTAQGLYNMSTPIQNGQQQVGDLVFFQGTYNTPNTVTHVGYYVGNGVMLHCGNPIGYVNINNSAYAKNFYSFGRIN